MKRGRPNRTTMMTLVTAVLLLVLPVIASAQGRGRGLARGHDKSWKCSVFVNCHDARNGRWDGRGPNRTVGTWRNGIFVPRGTSVRYRNRNSSTNDYWRRRHLTYRRRNFDDDNFLRSRTMGRSDRDFRNNGLFRGKGRGRP